MYISGNFISTGSLSHPCLALRPLLVGQCIIERKMLRFYSRETSSNSYEPPCFKSIFIYFRQIYRVTSQNDQPCFDSTTWLRHWTEQLSTFYEQVQTPLDRNSACKHPQNSLPEHHDDIVVCDVHEWRRLGYLSRHRGPASCYHESAAPASRFSHYAHSVRIGMLCIGSRQMDRTSWRDCQFIGIIPLMLSHRPYPYSLGHLWSNGLLGVNELRRRTLSHRLHSVGSRCII